MNEFNIGTPTDDLESKKRIKRNFFNIKEGSNVYRILPPFKDLAQDGIWFQKQVIHWGYEGAGGMPRNFACLGSSCPECVFVEKTKKELETVTSEKASVMLKSFLDEHHLEIVHVMNAMDRDEKIGLLKMKTRLWQDFGRERTELKAFGIHPADAERGVWMNFEKTGQGTTALWKATAVRDSVLDKGEVVSRLKVSPLSKETLTRMQTEAFELNKVVRKLDFEQVQGLVVSLVDYQSDPEVVDAVFSSGRENPIPSASSGSIPVSNHATNEGRTSASMSDEDFKRIFKRG
ncbi:MAG: hypothetical protein KGO96_07595 [Elusimicrobia bacterium]|nr:hypothetical protein [Elusimicrobiota bacterium]